MIMKKLYAPLALLSLAACEASAPFLEGASSTPGAEAGAPDPSLGDQIGGVVGQAVEQGASGASPLEILAGAAGGALAILGGLAAKKKRQAAKEAAGS